MITLHNIKRFPIVTATGLVVFCACTLLLIKWLPVRHTRQFWPPANSISLDSNATPLRLRDVLYSIDDSVLAAHLRVDARTSALRSAAEEAFSTYLCGDGAAVLAYIDTNVIGLAAPSDMVRHRGWGDFTSWFWSSLRQADGQATVRTAVLAGVAQELRSEGENNMITLRTEGLPCFDDPKSSQFCYEIRLPVMYNTPDGKEHRVDLGLFFQWDNRKQDWVQTGSSMYGFPVNQPLVRLPG